MNLQSLINSRYGIGFALFLGKIIPTRLGYSLAKTMAERISNRKDSPMVRAARLNQWMVSGRQLTGEELDQAVNKTFRSSAHSQFDLYHNIKNQANLINLIKFTPRAEEIMDRCKTPDNPILVVGLHLSNLDVAFLALGSMGIKAYGISVPNPGGGYQWQNDIRSDYGFKMLPASKEAIREAAKRYKEGYTVITAVDRPIPESKYQPVFFGHRSALPVVHIILALRLNTPVHLASTTVDADGKYLTDVSTPIHIKPYSDRTTTIMRNAESVLEVAEAYIQKTPHQWAMYYPVWPDLIDEVPD